MLFRLVFNPTYKQKKKVKKYIWDLYQKLNYSYKVGIVFSMYQKMRTEGTSWDGPRHVLGSSRGISFQLYPQTT